MENDYLKDHIWLATLLTPLYSMLKDVDNLEKTGLNSHYVNFVFALSQENSFFQQFNQSIQSYINNQDLIEEIIKTSYYLALKQDKTEKQKNNFESLHSVFSNLYSYQSKEIYAYSMEPLDLSNIFPSRDHNANLPNELFRSFVQELKLIKEQKQIFYLLEKYFWSISSSLSIDISLYDEIKTATAIALSLYKQYKVDQLTLEMLKQVNTIDTEQFLLIHGDISGIQHFIFNIPSKGAAKSLKGRSVYVSLLSDVISRYILDELELDETSLLYNGGGNFLILAPAYLKENLINIRKKISEKLLDAHDGEIYFAIEAETIKINEFHDFSNVWQRVKDKTNRLKKKKWSEMDLVANHNKIFGPIDEGSEEKAVCHVCGSFGSKRSIQKEKLDEEDVSVCTLCKSFTDLTDELKNAKYLVFRKFNVNTISYNNYQEILSSFGYSVYFTEKLPGNNLNQHTWVYKLNDTEFLKEGCSGYRFGAYQLPKGKDKQVTFQELAERSIVNQRGDKKLAYLKLDVDNLGSIFADGLGERRTIARVSALSRTLSLYFEGYINRLIKEKNLQSKLYVVFSGGDDTFIIGSWNTVFEFTRLFYEDFRKYTGFHPYLTFSAAVKVFNYHFPVIRAADLTDQALDSAKKIKDLSDEPIPPKKNKISFFGEVFNWEEYNQISGIENILEKMVLEYNRSVLFKVEKSTLGFKNILKDSTKGKFKNIKFWRLAYYLREINHHEKEKNKNYAEELIEQYRKIVVHNLFNGENREKIHQIMIIPVAIKWAELATRKIDEGEN